MQTKWLIDAQTADAQEKRKELIINCSAALDILSKICYNSIRSAEKSSTVDYDSPAWAYRQADQIGYRRALEEIIKLCDLNTK